MTVRHPFVVWPAHGVLHHHAVGYNEVPAPESFKNIQYLLLLLLWLQFLSNNIPGLGVKVLAYKYIKLNYEMFEDCHN